MFELYDWLIDVDEFCHRTWENLISAHVLSEHGVEQVQHILLVCNIYSFYLFLKLQFLNAGKLAFKAQ